MDSGGRSVNRKMSIDPHSNEGPVYVGRAVASSVSGVVRPDGVGYDSRRRNPRKSWFFVVKNGGDASRIRNKFKPGLH